METTLPRCQLRTDRFPYAVSADLFGVLDRQRGHLMPWCAVAFGIGVALYFSLRWEPQAFHAQVLLVSGTVVLALCFLDPLATLRPILIAGGLGILGFLSADWRAERVSAPVLEYRMYGPVAGRVVKVDRSASDKVRLTLDQVQSTKLAPKKTPRRVRVSLHGEQQFIRVKPGDFVMTTAHLSPPPGPAEPGGFDFQRHAWFERLGAVGYSRVPVLRFKPADKSSWLIKLQRFRVSLASSIRTRVGGSEGPFAAAILTGDRSTIPKEALDDLRASNLAHLLAISGLHMGLLTGVVFAGVRYLLALLPGLAVRLPTKKVAAVVALAAGFFYLGLSGANVATQRAFIMVAVMLTAVCLDRRALTLRAVAFAALIVLIIRPESIYGPGFQMSFAATTALVAGFRVWRDFGLGQWIPKVLRPIVGVVLSSFLAGIATAPFAAAHFNMFAQYGLLANLLSVPVMGLAVMPGAVIAGLMAPIGLEEPGVWIMRTGLAWILGVAHWVSDLDGAVIRVATPGAWAIPCVSFAGLFLCLWQGPLRCIAAVPLVAVFLAWNVTPRPDFLISDTGGLFGVATAQGRALNKPKGDGFAAGIWLENDGDTASQDTASRRLNADPNRVTIQREGFDVVFDRRKDLTEVDITQACDAFDLVFVVRFEGRLPCTGITAGSLRRAGTVAVWLEPELRFATSNGVRGDRPWVPTKARQ